MRVLICGDRHWVDEDAIRQVLSSIPNIEVVIEGGAKGADSLARKIAKELGISVYPAKVFRAKWEKYGRAAGPIRNRKMLEKGKPDLVIAFHNDLSRSKGTKNMLNQAKAHGVPIKVISNSSLGKVLTELRGLLK